MIKHVFLSCLTALLVYLIRDIFLGGCRYFLFLHTYLVRISNHACLHVHIIERSVKHNQNRVLRVRTCHVVSINVKTRY